MALVKPDRIQLAIERFERMTPEERRADLESRIIRDWAELPPDFVARIEATAARLENEHPTR